MKNQTYWGFLRGLGHKTQVNDNFIYGDDEEELGKQYAKLYLSGILLFGFLLGVIYFSLVGAR